MSTNYPGGLDSFTTHHDNNNEIILAAHINNIQDAVAAIETELGLTPRGSSADVAARLATLLTTATAASTYAWSGAAGISVASDPDVDVTGAAGSSTAVQGVLSAAAPGALVVVPAGAVIKLDASINIPATVTLRILGTVNLASAATIEMGASDARLVGPGTISATTGGASYSVRLGRSGCMIDGVRFTGQARTSAIRVSYEADVTQAGTITGCRISGCFFDATAYGILKQNAATITTNVHVTGNRFTGITGGDAIEWNVGTDDRGLLLSSNIIDGVSRGSIPNAGIGIGIAGGFYGAAITAQTRQFVVSGNIINSVGEGIHVEACNRFSITNNLISNCAVTSELSGSGIQVYGSTRFTVRGNTITDSALGAAVAYGGSFVECDKYTLASNDAISCTVGIKAWCEGVGYTAKILGNTTTDCTAGFQVRGLASWLIDGNASTGASSHTLDFTLINSGLSITDAVLGWGGNYLDDAAPVVSGSNGFAGIHGASPTFPTAAYTPLASLQETITYNTDGTVATVTETASGAVTTYTYNGDGTPATETRVLGGVTTVRTFTYSGGNLIGVS